MVSTTRSQTIYPIFGKLLELPSGHLPIQKKCSYTYELFMLETTDAISGMKPSKISDTA